MKIGILTFHSQINYGGLLQCWALQTELEGLGHEVVVIDRWFDDYNEALVGPYAKWGVKQWIKFSIRGVLGLGDFGRYRRHKKTKRFLKRYLKLTPYNFVKWRYAPEMLGIDLMVVGSDQVWHCAYWGDPSVYLLEGAERCNLPPVISYAASFGLKELPKDYVSLYKKGLARFKAISCREREGVEICKGLGYDATHVVDPTLLLEPAMWRKIIDEDGKEKTAKRRLICYFMSVDLKDAMPRLIEFSCKLECDVDVFVNNCAILPFPNSFGSAIKNIQPSKINICRSSDPLDFVKAFSKATWTLTDSFHAVMFSSIFECNARFVRPSDAMRSAMFARIEEFAASCVNGEFFVDDVEGALKSFCKGEEISYNQQKISQLRSNSLSWLKQSLGD